MNKGKSANLAEARARQALDTKDPFQHLSKFGRQFSPRFLKGEGAAPEGEVTC